MKVVFADSFWASLKNLKKRNSWWYKTYEFVRYGIPNFFANVWFFKKELLEFKPWDYSFNLYLFGRSLEKTAYRLEFGNEVGVTRRKKIEKIKRAVEIVRSIRNHDYYDRAEAELGEIKNQNPFQEYANEEDKAHDRKVYDRATEIENQEWEEFWQILKGQNHSDYIKYVDTLPEDENQKDNAWANWYNGSGMRHWWD